MVDGALVSWLRAAGSQRQEEAVLLPVVGGLSLLEDRRWNAADILSSTDSSVLYIYIYIYTSSELLVSKKKESLSVLVFFPYFAVFFFKKEKSKKPR